MGRVLINNSHKILLNRQNAYCDQCKQRVNFIAWGFPVMPDAINACRRTGSEISGRLVVSFTTSIYLKRLALNFEPFVLSSDVVNYDHLSIAKLASELQTERPETTAKRCFDWVRDNIQHCIDFKR